MYLYSLDNTLLIFPENRSSAWDQDSPDESLCRISLKPQLHSLTAYNPH